MEVDLQPSRSITGSSSDASGRIIDWRIDFPVNKWLGFRVGQWKINWLIGHTHILPQSMEPDSAYETDTGQGTPITFTNTSSDPTGNILKYRIVDGFRANVRTSHPSGWSLGWNGECNTRIQNIDMAFIALDPLIGYGLIDWFENRPNAMWLHGVQIGKSFGEQHKIELNVRNLTNKVYSIRPLHAEANRMFILKYTLEV